MWHRRPVWTLAVLLSALMIPECRPESLPRAPVTSLHENERALESELLQLTNLHRSLKQLPPLIPDRRLSAIAREQSSGMAQQGFISHELPSGNLGSRMRRAGYPHEIVRENVANTRNVRFAHNALFLKSPPHEQNILAQDVTHIGIGIVRSPAPFEDELFITEIFAGARKAWQPSSAQELLLNRIDKMRSEEDRTEAADPIFLEAASNTLLSLDYPFRSEDLRDVLAHAAARIQRLGRTDVSRIDASVQLVRDPKEFRIPQRIHEEEAVSYGSAVREVITPRNEHAFLILTLIGFQ